MRNKIGSYIGNHLMKDMFKLIYEFPIQITALFKEFHLFLLKTTTAIT